MDIGIETISPNVIAYGRSIEINNFLVTLNLVGFSVITKPDTGLMENAESVQVVIVSGSCFEMTVLVSLKENGLRSE